MRPQSRIRNSGDRPPSSVGRVTVGSADLDRGGGRPGVALVLLGGMGPMGIEIGEVSPKPMRVLGSMRNQCDRRSLTSVRR